MSKPFKITKPGKYRMRNGCMAVVTGKYRGHFSGSEHFIWSVRAREYGLDYEVGADGRFSFGEDPWDLVAPWKPKPRKPKPAKRAKAKWGVWVPANNRSEARRRARMYRAQGAEAVVKRSLK